MADKLSYALDYAKRGWAVLPLQFIRSNGKCSCGKPEGECKPGKHPLTTRVFKEGYKDATVDIERIKKTWEEFPQANVGWTLGKIVVVDQDNRHGGEENLKILESKYGPLPPTVTALTGSGDGSKHRYYISPNNGVSVANLNKIDGLAGLELKVNGYVVGVGSVTTKPYTWQFGASPNDMAFAPLPEWLAELSRQPFTSAEPKKPTPADKPPKKYSPITAIENAKALSKALDSCAFLKHCDVDAKVLPEPEWQAMVELLVFFGAPGEAKIHELSQPYPTYSEEATDTKIANANKAINKKQLGPYTCQKIAQSLGFPCPQGCLAAQSNTHTPVTMAIKAITAYEEPPLEEIPPSTPRTKSYIYLIDRYTPPEEAKRYTNVTQSVTGRDTEKANERVKADKALQAEEALSEQVKAWVKGTSGWWGTDELDKDLGIYNPQDKGYRRLILHRLKEQGMVEPHEKINKQWRYVNTRVTSLEFKTATNAGILPLSWPMGIEKKANLFPGNLVVVAGSPNSGKTAFNLSFIQRNQNQYPITYICSEMGAVELRNRLEQFPGMAIEDWSFRAIERATDFADVIVPDVINIVDYLEMTDELWEVNKHLTAISHKIGSGLAVISIQKKMGAKYGRGQEFSLEKPKLYLSMDKGVMQIVKAKSWATKADPHGLEIHFKIVGGCLFQPSSDWEWKR